MLSTPCNPNADILGFSLHPSDALEAADCPMLLKLCRAIHHIPQHVPYSSLETHRVLCSRTCTSLLATTELCCVPTAGTHTPAAASTSPEGSANEQRQDRIIDSSGTEGTAHVRQAVQNIFEASQVLFWALLTCVWSGLVRVWSFLVWVATPLRFVSRFFMRVFVAVNTQLVKACSKAMDFVASGMYWLPGK